MLGIIISCLVKTNPGSESLFLLVNAGFGAMAEGIPGLEQPFCTSNLTTEAVSLTLAVRITWAFFRNSALMRALHRALVGKPRPSSKSPSIKKKMQS